MKKYTYEINGKEVSELEAKMNGNYTKTEYIMTKYGWAYNGHYIYTK